MYQKKSEIIGKIQSYHKQVADLYNHINEKVTDPKKKKLLNDLFEHEKEREAYLSKHKKIAEVMNSWLIFPCERLSNQIKACFEGLNTSSEISMEELLKLEMHFDDCLIKLYNILSSENALNETLVNTFYYMLKKTKKEKDLMADMLQQTGANQ